MHRLYVTEGIVLAKRGVGEANVLLSVITPELGLVRASARSTRVEQSKLRFGLELLTAGRFTFVRGRHEWKLVGVEDISHGYVSPEAARRRAAGRIARLLLRLIHGEDPVADLYDIVAEGLTSLVGSRTAAEAENVECVLVLRVLAQLGYVPSDSRLAPFFEDARFPDTLLASAALSRTFLIRTINDSLAASGL